MTAAACRLVLLGLAALSWPAMAAAARPSAAPAEATSLTVSLTVDQPKIVQPLPARVTLRLHNAGANPLWLYRHVRDQQELVQARSRAAGSAQNPAGWSTGGSSLVIHLEPAEAGTEKSVSPQASKQRSGQRPANADWPRSKVLASVGMPHPRLVKVAPGGDATEGAVIELEPALAGEEGHEEPVWGRYRLSVSYNAAYSNGDVLSRNLNVNVWQGEVTSNTVDIDLEPATAAAGSVGGRIAREDGNPLIRMLVSLSDREDHLVNQVVTDEGGRYSFSHLPWGLYWVTARRPESDFETATYDHVDLEAGNPSATLNLVMLQPEVYEPKQMLHKPVLLKVTSGAGQPLEGVALEVLWSSGTVAETVKGETAADGTASLEVIPGRNYVTLKRRGCQNEERRLDVAAGDGIDGLSLQFDCSGH